MKADDDMFLQDERPVRLLERVAGTALIFMPATLSLLGLIFI
jgi:hypothetical protein